MKFYSYIIIFLFIISNTYSQQDTVFNNIYTPYHGTTGINSLISADNFYYALYSQLDTPDLIQNYGILKFDKKGSIIDSSLWGHIDTSVAFNFGHTFVKTSDNNFVFCGSTKDSYSTVRGILVKVDNNLDTIWTKWFNHPDTLIASQANPSDIYSTLTDIKETPDGGYILVGNYNKNCIGNAKNGFLIKTDTLGNFLWINILPTTIYDIEIDRSDSGFFFPASTNGQAPLKLFKTDKFGNTIWSTNVNTMSYPSYPMDADIVDTNTVFVASAFWVNGSTSSRSVVVASVNSSTNSTNWEKNYSFYDYLKGKTLHQSIGTNLTPSGNIAISSTVYIENNGYRGSLLLINQAGDSLWQRYYAHTYSDSNNVDVQLNDLVVCEDGGFLLGGDYDYSSMYDHCWLVKTDSLGFAPATFTLTVEEKYLVISQKPLLYPNPAQSNINLKFDESSKSPLTFLIYNSSGVLVKKETQASYMMEYRINIEDLEKGVYFIQILSEDKKVFSGKFVKM